MKSFLLLLGIICISSSLLVGCNQTKISDPCGLENNLSQISGAVQNHIDGVMRCNNIYTDQNVLIDLGLRNGFHRMDNRYYEVYDGKTYIFGVQTIQVKDERYDCTTLTDDYFTINKDCKRNDWIKYENPKL